MHDTALLTDDEIVALCAADGRPWPIGLSTVDPTVEELTRAGVRGMRSLMVRRLAGSDADAPGIRPHAMIARDVSTFLDAQWRVGAYVAPASDHSVLGGATVTAAYAPEGWILDTATAAGVHALRLASTDEAVAAVLALAETLYRGMLFTDSTGTSDWVCVLRYGHGAQQEIVIGHHTVTGEVDGHPVTVWDPALVADAFRRF